MEITDIIMVLEEDVKKDCGMAELATEQLIRNGHLHNAAAHGQAIELIRGQIMGGRWSAGTAG